MKEPITLNEPTRRLVRNSQRITSSHDLVSVVETQRHRIVTLLRDAALSATQIARELGLPRSRMYYHLRILQSRGFIRAERSRGVTCYRATATNFIVDRERIAGSCGENCLNEAQAEILRRAADDFAHGQRTGDERANAGIVMAARTFIRMRASRAAALRARLASLFEELDTIEDEQGGHDMELLIAFFPLREV